ncbi:MAG: phenylalanine--tRNA ligase subunit beta [Acidimicrobiales bacterium]|nr:phenylalanine--tRNA ligase subunit beta [Acidimicrobiales bacterium]
MKVLLSWLREFAPIEGSPTQIADQMSMLGMAVESMDVFDPMESIVVARVLDLKPHPDADRIQLVDVDPGDGGPLQICCGAFNMAVGDLVPLATIGTVMPNGMEIAKRKMRGEVSNGMLCSAAEIGLGSDHAGIFVLPSDMEVGRPLMAQLGLAGDVLYDLEINPNRPDAMSVAGVARDLAAQQGVPFAIPAWEVDETGERVEDIASVSIHDPDLCGRFVARVLRNVTVGVSPIWMRMRLTLCGMRPINSVVDVSNYVMLELGTPNHTYDLDKVPGGHLGVRRAVEGETITTLDDATRTLRATDGVIVDANDVAIGIAGVMGGASTEIGDSTSAVLLEMAWWDERSIAVSSASLGLRSEASARFERGTDWDLNLNAVNRFCSLLSQQGATVASGAIDVVGNLRPRPVVPVRVARVNHMLGTDLSGDQIVALLEPIGFECELADGVITTTIPTFRPDCEVEIDVIEEVARHHGYEAIDKTVPKSPVAGHLTADQRARRALKATLAGAGFNEIVPSPFLSPDAVSRSGLDLEAVVRVRNPLAAEESIMRPSLLPGMLATIAYNHSHRSGDVSLFEIGNTFGLPLGGEVLPNEVAWLAVAVSGADATVAKRVWDMVSASVGIDGATLTNRDDLLGLHPTRAAEISLDGRVVGRLGEVDPGALESWSIAGRVAWLEVEVAALLGARVESKPYVVVSTQPTSDIDLAFTVPDDIQASTVEATLVQAAADELAAIKLFDVYRGAQVGDGARSVAWALRLQAADRTLTDSDIAAIRQRCIDAVEKAHGASLRA